MPGMLDKDELKRRIDAFRTLRGLTQADLAEKFASKGHGTQELGRLERGALPLTEIRRRSLAEILEVPERWFVDETLTVADYKPGPSTQLDRLEQAIADIAQRETDAHQEREGIMALLAQQSQILADIAALLTRQDEILAEIQRVVAGMPDDDALRLLNEGAAQLTEAARSWQVAPGESPASRGGTRRRQVGE